MIFVYFFFKQNMEVSVQLVVTPIFQLCRKRGTCNLAQYMLSVILALA